MIIDYPKTKEKIVNFISSKTKGHGAVIGLSGGIDSALTAYLTTEALGKEKVLGLLMPEKGLSSKQDIIDAEKVAKILNIDYKIIEISPVLNVYSSIIPNFDKNNRGANGNLKARTRMTILYYHANMMNRMVIGTGNKTELFLGYFTKYGDGGVDIEPIGELYKTQVRGLSKYMNIPDEIITKIPTAGLWEGQTDEGELGVSYDTADAILYHLIDKKESIEIVKKSYHPEIVDRLTKLISSSNHKRMPPPSAIVT